MLLSILFFILAGLAEIGGGYLVWLYMRDDKGPLYLIAVLLFYSYMASSHLPARSKLRQSIRSIRRRIHCPLYSMGLACGRLTTRYVRYHRRPCMPRRCIYHHVCATLNMQFPDVTIIKVIFF